MNAQKKEIIAKLRQEILASEGFRPPQPGAAGSVGLGFIESSLPNGIFPTGTIHEFISTRPEETSASGAFISGIVKALLNNGGICVWVSFTRRVYPPVLKLFGVDPVKVIFIDVPRQRDVLWVTEEALKCRGIVAVVCETRDLSFMESRRLQLAVEKSHVTGFVLRKDAKKVSANAAIARWQVRPVRSKLRTGMPGVGFPRWRADLLRIKNGNPGSWTVEWRNGMFHHIPQETANEKLIRYA